MVRSKGRREGPEWLPARPNRGSLDLRRPLGTDAYTLYNGMFSNQLQRTRIGKTSDKDSTNPSYKIILPIVRWLAVP